MWYFHRQNSISYKSGTYKGVDITFGDTSKRKVYGGILIRSIYDVKNKCVIEGPCKVVDHVLKKNNVLTIDELVRKAKDNNENIDDIIPITNNKLLHIEKDNDNTLDDLDIYASPRVGLTSRKYTESRERYLMNNYRFINRIKDVKKYRCGMVLSMYEKGISNDEINKITGSYIRNIEKYIEIYEQSKKDGTKANEYNGKN